MGVYIVLAGLFALLAVLIAAGWGDWLIAGYNTASKEERSHYYRGRLRVVMSSTCAAVAILIAVDGLCNINDITITFTIISIVVLALILANTWTRRR